MMSIAAIIVAGGYSSRMGDFKPFLYFGDETAIEMLVNTYKSVGINQIIVVTGYRGNEIEERLKGFEVFCIQNECFAKGMFTSIQAGSAALGSDVTAFFIQPVDIPLVKKSTVEALIKQYIGGGKGILYPEFCGNIGHPPLIDCRYREAILKSNGEGGLKNLLQVYADDSMHVPVFDKSILMDMDTKEDYEALLAYYYSNAPDLKECYRILELYHVPDNIVKHCREVTLVSEEILCSLQNAGCFLNVQALMAATMLHDIAKSQRNHALAGKDLLSCIGYCEVGDIIGSHTNIEVDDEGEITESEILYLADKLVREDRMISLVERFDSARKKYRNDPEALSNIEHRRDAAYKIIQKIESVTHTGFIYG